MRRLFRARRKRPEEDGGLRAPPKPPGAARDAPAKPWRRSIQAAHRRSRRRGQSRGAARRRSGRFARMRPEFVVALVLRQARWDFFPVEEVAHDAIGDGPIIAVHAVMVRAQRSFTGEL